MTCVRLLPFLILTLLSDSGLSASDGCLLPTNEASYSAPGRHFYYSQAFSDTRPPLSNDLWYVYFDDVCFLQ